MGNFYTVQSLEVVEGLRKTGRFVCDQAKSALIQEQAFKKAYDWMVEQMTKRIGPPPEGVNYPVWAFLDGNSDWEYGNGEPGDTMVRIDFTIDDSRVVASDFNDWHFVINDWFLDDSEDEASEEEALEDEASKVESWQGIFRETCDDVNCQFTFWELRLEDITNITQFVVPECDD